MSEKYYRHTVMEIDLDAIAHNYEEIHSKHRKKTFIAVVKANAYSLGSAHIAKFLETKGIDFFAVATMDEAIELRMNGVKSKILVLGVITPKDINKAIQHRIAVTAPSLEWVKKAKSKIKDKYDKEVWIHIKVNIGMNRLGTSDTEEIKKMIKEIHDSSHLVYEGIYTHYSTADSKAVTEEEHTRFLNVLHQVERPEYVHTSNSAAALGFNATETNALRVGLALYGYYPSNQIKSMTDVKLKASLTLKTEVANIHKVTPGETVSYNGTFKAKQETYIAALPIGYADGILRQFTGFNFSLNGYDTPIVGTICMDYSMIEVPKETKVGDEVIIISKNSDEKQSLYEFSNYVHTIPYESLCHLSRRLPRKYITNDESTVYNEVLK